ncbi:hypothetical protein N7468_009311 [Penicillium chermesinum]|uniref:DUF1993 domain-containing protein n=1 Tax=Penicillium chermesinum TaxID=63820 RepID=A0A9W9NHK4_9EURO|nr:uncharacterized protein N7468_009311 [Penicillium chermesinum]KAJ5220107.1 hypothetical protein N7468_009311 [Penicillium chermesinum]KAJ6157554.1 hypothetical protein N7470_005146 [Penicillium chermesinum]
MVYTVEDGFLKPAKNALQALRHCLQKAQEHPNSASFPDKRIIDDMHPLTFQVRAVTSSVFWALTALTDGAIASPNDGFPKVEELTWDQLYEHIDSALKALDSADNAYIIEHVEKVRKYKIGPMERESTGTQAAQIMQANIFFHVTTAYAILRKEGVPLGKTDYLGHFLA